MSEQLKSKFWNLIVADGKDYDYISLNRCAELMQAAYDMAKPKWIDVCIQEPELETDIWIWSTAFNDERIITCISKDAFKHFKYWRPIILLGNPT